jgi:hypothetical protein
MGVCVVGFAEEGLWDKVQQGVPEETPDGEGDHDGEGGGVDVTGAEGEEEIYVSPLAIHAVRNLELGELSKAQRSGKLKQLRDLRSFLSPLSFPHPSLRH